MEKITNIIFDLGGVFLDVDYFKTENRFIEAGIKDFHHLYSQSDASPLFEYLETGKIDEEAFCAELRNISKTELTNHDIINCWNAMLGNFWPEAIEWLAKINQRYTVYLFSNTNAIHYKAFLQIFEQQFGRTDFDNYFHKAYYSHLMGMRKPYADSYHYIIKQQGLDVQQTVFIDDTLKNIEGAREAGLQTIHLVKGMKVWELPL